VSAPVGAAAGEQRSRLAWVAGVARLGPHRATPWVGCPPNPVALAAVDVTALDIEGAWTFTPRRHDDDRGHFAEWFKADVVAAAIGHPFTLVQANVSQSRAGTVRGVHFAQLAPSQAKYVFCPSGAVLDVVVDIRTGSPTFGAVRAVRLDDVQRTAIYLSEGLGHAFVALTEDATVTYLCSAGYAPGREHAINPMDPALGLTALPGWPVDTELLLSEKDTGAPSLAEAAEQGLLPTYEEVLSFRRSLA
jgi:dTDP-4-dehydrorhamnose 3,5-epimerase